MVNPALATFISITIISALSLIGIVTLGIREQQLQRRLHYLVSFAVGGLFGSAFLHLLPKAVANTTFSIQLSLFVLGGIVIAFAIETFIHWHHCHTQCENESHSHPHAIAYMNLIGDAIHNALDGLIIAVSFLTAIPVGIATAVAVITHEIPQEIGDFGVLLHSGFTKKTAIVANFFIALTAFVGAAIPFVFQINPTELIDVLLPFAAGNFIYIAGSDLVPELKEQRRTAQSVLQMFMLLAGIAIMLGLRLV